MTSQSWRTRNGSPSETLFQSAPGFRLHAGILSAYEIQKKFEACKNFNLYSTWAQEELYRRENDQAKFFAILDHNMKPIYESAYLQGYEIWKND